MKRTAPLIAAALVSSCLCLCLGPGSAQAWNTMCRTWDGNQVFDVCLDGSCSGTWGDEFKATMASWSTVLGDPHFAYWSNPDSWFGYDNGDDEVVWTTLATFNSAYGPLSSNALAVTVLTGPSCGAVDEADILFFVDHSWTTSRSYASSSSAYYFGEVAAHELGHAALLDHEDDYLTLMNSSAHSEPLVRYAHVDERLAIDAKSTFAEGLFHDHALLPYDAPNTSSLFPSGANLLGSTSVAPGDAVGVEDVRVENWGSLGATDIHLDLVLSSNDIGSLSDTVLGRLTWSGVTGWGYITGGSWYATVPVMPSGSYYVIGVVDADQAVNEQYGWNNQWVFGQVTVDADGDNDGYDVAVDCDDGDPSIHPGAAEQCNGDDDNCNGTLPADEQDGDSDSWMPCEGDCNDGSSSIHPGATEQCNGTDDDCSGALPADEQDVDGDAWMACEGDCHDGDASVHPGATEQCNGVDDDCDGSLPGLEQDDDGDLWMVCEGDCDDGQAQVFPGAAELCDGVDDDCDGAVPAEEHDMDGDGWMPCEGDCADDDPGVRPDAEELCDGVDTDCAGGLPDDETDRDEDGLAECAGDCDDEAEDVFPGAEETCDDGVDQDCDGEDCEGPRDDTASRSRSCSAAGGSPGDGPALLVLLALMAGLRRRGDPRRRRSGRSLRRGRSGTAAGALVAMLSLAAGAAGATTVAPMTEGDLIGLSERVVLGEVVEVEVDAWGPAEVPVTRVRIAVEESWKGTWEADLVFYQAGGVDEDGREMQVAGALRFEPGQTVVVFAERSPSGVLVVAGFSLGALRLDGGRLAPLEQRGTVEGGDGHGDHQPPDGQRPEAVASVYQLPFVGLDATSARGWVLSEVHRPRPAPIPLVTEADWRAAVAQVEAGGGEVPVSPAPALDD